MNKKDFKWEILNKKSTRGIKSTKSIKGIVDILLGNRGIKTKKEKKEFFNPKRPENLMLKDLGIRKEPIKKVITRVKKAIINKEEIIIYGDYDCDGICATAILWETLYSLTKNVKPYIPDRFEEGYGANAKSIGNLKSQYPNFKLLITVDNGIVANSAVDKANELGIDVIVTDHHQIGEKIPKAYSIIHTDKISGSGISWLLAREIRKEIKASDKTEKNEGLELAAIGTIADQLPIIGPNRSLAKYGLQDLNQTKRPGILAMLEEAGIKKSAELSAGRRIGTYEINYIIAPRINAMGRMEHAIDSLRLLCTRDMNYARELARLLGKTNRERQKIVDEATLHAREFVKDKEWNGAIVVSHESYHEGVIGLVASKLVEEFYRPSIVISKGKEYSKASGRSISGFNIIEEIRKHNFLIEGGGGHPMAAGFTIKTENISAFFKAFSSKTAPLLSSEVLQKKLKIDIEIDFIQINSNFLEKLKQFEPFGIGNPKPLFASRRVDIINVKTVGAEAKHLKMVLRQGNNTFNAIAFGFGALYQKILLNKSLDIVYSLEEDNWNNRSDIQLTVKDIKI